MTFFNSKEESVIIELTKHGRELLSKGQMKPVYYAFSDDDILYDSQKGGFSEVNSAIKTRIVDETPRLKPISSKKIESDHSNIVGHEDYDHDKRSLIGTVSHNNTLFSPSWDATLLDGEITSVTNTIDSVATVDCVFEYSMSFGRVSDRNESFSNYGMNPVNFKADGSFLNIEENNLLLHLEEKNTDINKDNFELEVYIYEHDEQTMNQLHFIKRPSNVINNIYVDDVKGAIEPTPDHVEYYFNVTFDREIPDEDVCEGISNLKSKNIYLDYDIKCPDREPGEINIYGSEIEDLEDC
tara:strand:- start:2536 stop:3426 length:891 start_codon:yes stop_codon:yes gene_type:complete